MENWVLKRSRISPDQLGLVYGNQTWTFKDIAEASLRMAAAIHDVSPELKRVAVIGGNTADFYLLLLSLQHLAVEVVVLNNRLSLNEIKQQVIISEPDLVIYEKFYEQQVAAVSTPKVVLGNWQEPDLTDFAPVDQVEPWQVATIMFTSGTTGTPKGVKQTFGNHLASAIGSVLNLGMLPDDKWLLTVPLYHISGYSMLVKSLLYGNTVYLVDKFDPRLIGELVASVNITHISLVPTMLAALLKEPTFLKGESLRCLLLGGAPLSAALLARSEEANLPIIQSFGMTETASQVLALNSRDAKRKRGSSGQPLLPVEVRIEATESGIGEILIKGPNVSPGYLNVEMAKTRDGFFKTGDIGYLDDEGFLYVVGRGKELIISGGENIYPLMVENALTLVESIKEVAVVGEEDDYWGEKVVAYVVTSDNQPLNLTAISAQIEADLGTFKQPKIYYQVVELPRNSLGKLQKSRLAQLDIIATYYH